MVIAMIGLIVVVVGQGFMVYHRLGKMEQQVEELTSSLNKIKGHCPLCNLKGSGNPGKEEA